MSVSNQIGKTLMAVASVSASTEMLHSSFWKEFKKYAIWECKCLGNKAQCYDPSLNLLWTKG